MYEPALSSPLSEQPPPKVAPRDPVLLLGLSYTNEELEDVYRNDLVYSRTSQWPKTLPRKLDNRLNLRILEYLDGKALMALSTVCHGTVVMDETLVDNNEEILRQMIIEAIFNKQRRFRAIVVSDTVLSSNSVVRSFVEQQHEEFGVNIVVMALHGCSLDFMAEIGVFWSMVAYARQTFRLTKAGENVLGDYAFPFASTRCKSHFVNGEGQELFELTGDDASSAGFSGSPVIVYNNRGRCISYFGFINSSNVSYGAIVLRLCDADQYTTSDN